MHVILKSIKYNTPFDTTSKTKVVNLGDNLDNFRPYQQRGSPAIHRAQFTAGTIRRWHISTRKIHHTQFTAHNSPQHEKI
jgi:hypothetical protein